MGILKKSQKSKKAKKANKVATPTVDLDKLAKDNETSANLTDYQAYLRNRMKGIKLV